VAVADGLEMRGGAAFLDAVLYDEVLPWSVEPGELCDLVHRELIVLGFEGMGSAPAAGASTEVG